MEKLYFAAEAAATCFESFVILLTLFRVLKSDLSKGKQRAVIAIGSLIFAGASMGVELLGTVYGDLPDLIVVGLYIAFSMTVFRSRRSMKLLLPVVLMIMILIINIFVAAAASRLSGAGGSATLRQSGMRIVTLFVTKSLFFISSQLLAGKLSVSEPELSADEWLWLTAIFIFSSVMLFTSAQMMFYGTDKDKSVLLLTVGIAVINAGVYVFADRLTRKNRQLYGLKMINLRTAEQLRSLRSIEDVYTQMRILRHDMKNQWIIVNDALESGDIERAKQSAEKMLVSIDSYSEAVKLSSPGISALLNFKLAEAKKKNIPAVTSINDCFEGFDESDIVMLLANLLDNAIEGSAGVPEPRIELTAGLRRGYLNIAVTNRIGVSVLSGNPKLATSKPDKLSHGLGLRSVAQICEKYGGSAEYREENGAFTADILLKLRGDG